MKKVKKVIVTGICIIGIIFILYWLAFVDMGHLPVGIQIGSFPSPNGDYIINAYICGGNATSGESIRCEVSDGKRTRNIYWQYKESDVQCHWITNRKVEINGVQLDVITDTYDWRKK